LILSFVSRLIRKVHHSHDWIPVRVYQQAWGTDAAESRGRKMLLRPWQRAICERVHGTADRETASFFGRCSSKGRLPRLTEEDSGCIMLIMRLSPTFTVT